MKWHAYPEGAVAQLCITLRDSETRLQGRGIRSPCVPVSRLGDCQSSAGSSKENFIYQVSYDS